jgi:uncharacterized membrane protein YeiH
MVVQNLEEIRPYIELTRPYLEFTAVVFGAVSGALHAKRRSFNFVGVVIIGIVSGLGGGVVRDVLIGRGPVLALQSPTILVVAIVASLIGVLFDAILRHLRPVGWVVDTLSLGLFAVAGLQRAQAARLSVTSSVFLGVVTCVGGGLVRDVLCRETPLLLLPGQPYTVVALFAGVIYMSALHTFHLSALAAELLAVGGAFALRSFAAWRGWVVPVPPTLAGRKRRPH